MKPQLLVLLALVALGYLIIKRVCFIVEQAINLNCWSSKGSAKPKCKLHYPAHPLSLVFHCETSLLK